MQVFNNLQGKRKDQTRFSSAVIVVCLTLFFLMIIFLKLNELLK